MAVMLDDRAHLAIGCVLRSGYLDTYDIGCVRATCSACRDLADTKAWQAPVHLDAARLGHCSTHQDTGPPGAHASSHSELRSCQPEHGTVWPALRATSWQALQHRATASAPRQLTLQRWRVQPASLGVLPWRVGAATLQELRVSLQCASDAHALQLAAQAGAALHSQHGTHLQLYLEPTIADLPHARVPWMTTTRPVLTLLAAAAPNLQHLELDLPNCGPWAHLAADQLSQLTTSLPQLQHLALRGAAACSLRAVDIQHAALTSLQLQDIPAVHHIVLRCPRLSTLGLHRLGALTCSALVDMLAGSAAPKRELDLSFVPGSALDVSRLPCDTVRVSHCAQLLRVTTRAGQHVTASACFQLRPAAESSATTAGTLTLRDDQRVFEPIGVPRALATQADRLNAMADMVMGIDAGRDDGALGSMCWADVQGSSTESSDDDQEW